MCKHQMLKIQYSTGMNLVFSGSGGWSLCNRKQLLCNQPSPWQPSGGATCTISPGIHGRITPPTVHRRSQLHEALNHRYLIWYILVLNFVHFLSEFPKGRNETWLVCLFVLRSCWTACVWLEALLKYLHFTS